MTVKATTIATANQLSCFFHALRTKFAGMSVCPAENTIRMPNVDSKRAITSSG